MVKENVLDILEGNSLHSGGSGSGIIEDNSVCSVELKITKDPAHVVLVQEQDNKWK